MCFQYLTEEIVRAFNDLICVVMSTCNVDMTTRWKLTVLTHPVDEKGLDEFDNLQCDQETYWYQVVEKDNEGQEVEAKVGSPTICQGKCFGQKAMKQKKTHQSLLGNTS